VYADRSTITEKGVEMGVNEVNHSFRLTEETLIRLVRTLKALGAYDDRPERSTIKFRSDRWVERGMVRLLDIVEGKIPPPDSPGNDPGWPGDRVLTKREQTVLEATFRRRNPGLFTIFAFRNAWSAMRGLPLGPDRAWFFAELVDDLRDPFSPINERTDAVRDARRKRLREAVAQDLSKRHAEAQWTRAGKGASSAWDEYLESLDAAREEGGVPEFEEVVRSVLQPPEGEPPSLPKPPLPIEAPKANDPEDEEPIAEEHVSEGE
jgi:hypothetical protein